MSASYALLDCGTIAERPSLFILPAAILGSAHDRLKGVDKDTLIMSTLKFGAVPDALEGITSRRDQTRRPVPVAPNYQAGPASKQVVRIVLSHTNYVSRTLWRKVRLPCKSW